MWMSPSTLQSYDQFNDPFDSKSSLFTDIFSDDIASAQSNDQFLTPIQPQDNPFDLGKLAKEDPLATQVWKMYARTKAKLPHAQRMENITWRMMALALKKKKEDESISTPSLPSLPPPPLPSPPPQPVILPLVNNNDERGRRIDKGKTKVRVVGFDGTNQDDVEDEEFVFYRFL